MFNYITAKPSSEPGKPRYMTAGVSAMVHVFAVGMAVGLPILYASDDLPEPPDMMAFVMEAPVPPPPPPAPVPQAPAPKNPTPSTKPAVEVPKPLPQANPVAAPVEAPSAITPETGKEADAGSAAPKIEAGFEGGIAGGVVGGAVGGIEAGEPPPPPAPKVPQGPVRVGGQIKAPQLVHRVNPTYPPIAQSARTEGSVVLEAVVDKAGHVQTVKVVRSQPLLDAAAIEAVKQWRYEPLNLNGEPTPFILTVTVAFTMPK
jgi:periplasmic protein TonB